MKAIIFIGTNKSGSSREAIKAAEELGFFTVLFTNKEKQILQRDEYTDVHEMIFIDIEDISAMRQEIKKLQLQGKEIATIVSFVDPYVSTASLLSNEFCNKNNSSEAILKMENKVETRSSLKNMPYTPKFVVLNPSEALSVDKLITDLPFPLMVKSPKSTGSKDALLAEDENQLKKQISKIIEKYPNEDVIIEEYIDGDQYLVEAIVYEKEVMIAAIIEQEITKGKRFIVTGYGVLAEVPKDIQSAINHILHSVVKEIGLENGALHMELRLGKNGWKLIEINPRISGGAMNKMIQTAFGYNLVKETLQLYLGEKPVFQPTSKNYVFTQYIILSKRGTLQKVTGKNRARRSPGIVDVYVKPKKGTLLTPPLSMGHRYAYVIAVGKSMEEAKHFAKNASKEIEFFLIEE